MYGDKEFYIRPITLGFDKQFEAIAVRPSDSEDQEYPFVLEGEFGIGEDGFNREKREYRDVNVKYIYFKEEANLFTPDHLEKVELYCDFAI